jgi:hypothetical protein
VRQAAHTDGVQARDEHPAWIEDAAIEDIGTERDFMDALRVLKARSGLSYRDIATRVSRAAPRHAMAKSTLAAFFARDTLPRRPGQLTATVDVLAGELTESADVGRALPSSLDPADGGPSGPAGLKPAARTGIAPRDAGRGVGVVARPAAGTIPGTAVLRARLQRSPCPCHPRPGQG